MYQYEIGQTYPVLGTKGVDSCKIDYTKGGIFLEIFAHNLSPKDLKSFKKDEVQLAIYEKMPVILILYKIGTFMPWSDAPYSWHLTLKNKVELSEIEEFEKEEKGILVTLLLIDSDTNILKDIRAIGAGLEFRNEFFRGVKKQIISDFNKMVYDTTLNQIYRYKTKELLQLSSKRFLIGE